MMTRTEHIAWCKTRAFDEFKFYAKKNLSEAIRNGITSMMSDLGKHPDTSGQALQALCMMELMNCHSETAFSKFINGFN